MTLEEQIEFKKTELAEVRRDRDDFLTHIEVMEEQLDVLDDTIDDLEHELAELEADLEQARTAAEDE